MDRRAFLGMLPGVWVASAALRAGPAEVAVAHLRIDGMT